MSNLVKYGKYFISAGIAIGGAVWLQRPKDVRIKGEDIADLYGAVQDCYVVPYLVGDALPDWQAANDGNTTTVGAAISYYDIATLANRSRLMFQNSDSAIFWTDETITNQCEIAISRGGYYATNTLSTLVDKLGTPAYVTNQVLRYSTNTFADVIATTASRMAATNSQFEHRIASGYLDALTATNLPIANLVFDSGEAVAIVSTGIVNGSKWPYTRSYSYPWEQWSDISRSRVTVDSSARVNCFYAGIDWIKTNDLELSFALTATNGAGYAVSQFVDIYGRQSLPFVTIAPPANNNGLYLDVYTKSIGAYEYYTLTIRKGATAQNQEVTAENVYGYPQRRIVYNQAFYDSKIDFVIESNTNVLSIVKFTSANTNVQPIYFCISYTNAPVLANAYFSLDAFAFSSTATGDAKLSAMALSQEVRDDKRISTNKLNQLAHVITNMTRTIYIGGETTLSWTNKYQVVKESEPYTYYWDESLSGTGNYTPVYNDGYTIGTYLTDYRDSVSSTVTNSSTSMTPGMLIASLVFSFDADALGEVYTDGDWGTRTFVVGLDNTRKQYGYKGCTPTYPATWAVTNGYVKKVSIYAVYEPSAINPRTYPMPEDDTYSHSVSGEHYYSKNLGLTMESNTISTATDDIDTTISKFNFKTFNDSGNILDFNNKAVFNLVYEVENPTNKIVFDFQPKDVSHCSCEKYRYFFYQTGASNTNRTEVWYRDYSVNYEVRAPLWMVVVDWNFQHLGRGFTP